MKNFKYKIVGLLVLLLAVTNCQDEDQKFGDVVAPTNLTLDVEIVGQDVDNPNGDGSGFVNFTASASNAITFRYVFGDNTSDAVAPSGEVTHRYNLTGVNSYPVTVIATGTGGIPTSKTVVIDVFSAFEDQEAKDLLSGGIGESKVWYIASNLPGHLGVGPTIGLDIAINGLADQYWFPAFFSAPPFDKCSAEISSCFCSQELTFTQNTENELTFTLDNFGSTFFNGAHQLGIFGTEEGEDACFEFDTSGVSVVSLSPSDQDLPEDETRGTVMTFTEARNIGYYVGASSYEILDITEDFLYVRFLDALNADLAWYLKFSTTNPIED